MTRWSKVRAVASFELLSIVRSKGYLIATFGMPVFLLAYGGLVSLIGLFEEKQEKEKVSVYGVVDEAGILGLDGDVAASALEIPDAVRTALAATGQQAALSGPLALFENHVFRPFPSDAAARAALAERNLTGYFKIPREYVETGGLERYMSDEPTLGTKGTTQALGNLLRDRLLAGRVSDEIAARVRDPVGPVKTWRVLGTGEVREGGELAGVIGIIAPIAFAALLLISLMSSTGGLIQATAVEKENKVVEVLLASADPDEILLGKLAGVGATGLLQVAVWFGMFVAAAAAFAATLAALGVELPWAALAAGAVLFVLGYLFFGSLMLGTGSIGSNQREVQQWAMVWSLLAAIPMVFLPVLMHAPHGGLARALTFVPFATPVVVVFRLAFDPDGIAWWEVAGALGVLLGATWLAIRLGARLFRVGILLTGARPSLREILRQARLGG